MEGSSSNIVRRLDEVTISLEEEGEDTCLLVNRALVGKVLSDKGLNRGAVKNILCKAWGDPEGVKVSDIGFNLFLFEFQKEEEAVEVVQKGPWYVMYKLVSLQKWTPQAIMNEIDFSGVQFWVHIHGLPLENLNIKSAEKILCQLGEIMEIEESMDDGVFLRHFIRARVKINIHSPLSTGCWIPRRNLSNVWVAFKYEKLQDLCFSCGVIGHEQKSCKREKEMSVLNREVARYGAKLSVPPAKELRLIKEERARWKREPEKNAYSSTSSETAVQRALILSEKETWHRPSPVRGEEGDDGELPEGWVANSPEQSPSPTLQSYKDTISKSPYVPMPFSNLRLQKQYPGFILDDVERRFGEFPWRPTSMEAGVAAQRDRGGRSTLQQVTDTEMMRRKVERCRVGTETRGEKEKAVAGRQGGESHDNCLIDDKMGADITIQKVCLQEGKAVGTGSNDGSLDKNKVRRDGRLTSTTFGQQTRLQAKEKGKDKVVTEEYSLEKEREMSWEHFAQVQEDLRLMQEEVRLYYEGPKHVDPNDKETGTVGSPPQPTRVDLEFNILRPGLGPERLDQLGLEEHDIGLKKPVVLLDYPSPPDRYMSLNLAQEEITKCREKGEEFFKHVLEKKKESDRIKRVIEEGGHGVENFGQEYWVDFPPEGLEASSELGRKLQEEEEVSLVEGISKALILKRPRDLLSLNEERQEGDVLDLGYKKIKRSDTTRDMEGVEWSLPETELSFFKGEGNEMDIEVGGQKHGFAGVLKPVAEEAGLPMPPTSP